MNPQTTPLFIYGTLHPDRAPAEIAGIARTLQRVGAATVRGGLIDLGEYPGLILDDSPNAPLVPGYIFNVPDGPTLAALDAYEGFHVSNPAASLFQRTHVTATLPDGSERPCWVYVYNSNRRAIPKRLKQKSGGGGVRPSAQRFVRHLPFKLETESVPQSTRFNIPCSFACSM